MEDSIDSQLENIVSATKAAEDLVSEIREIEKQIIHLKNKRAEKVAIANKLLSALRIRKLPQKNIRSGNIPLTKRIFIACSKNERTPKEACVEAECDYDTYRSYFVKLYKEGKLCRRQYDYFGQKTAYKYATKEWYVSNGVTDFDEFSAKSS